MHSLKGFYTLIRCYVMNYLNRSDWRTESGSMTRRRTEETSIDFCKMSPRCKHGILAILELTEVRKSRSEIGTATLVYFMIAIDLRVGIYIISFHSFFVTILCDLERPTNYTFRIARIAFRTRQGSDFFPSSSIFLKCIAICCCSILS